jgi:hypothetical protein
MITKFMNKWTFTFCKYNCFPFHCVYLMQGFHHILVDICKYLMMQSTIWQMVCTGTFEDPILDIPEGSIGHGCGQVPRGGATPPQPRPLVSLEQLLAMQNDLMRRLVENDEHCGEGILCSRIFWQLTLQSLSMQLTHWRWAAGSAA